MEHSFYIITWPDIFVSLVLVAFCIGLIKWWRVGLESSILIGTVRTLSLIHI